MRESCRPLAGPWLLVMCGLLAMVAGGCDGTEGPDLPPLYDVAYSDQLSAPAAGDSIYVALCTGVGWAPNREVRVYLDTQPSGDENVRLDLHVVGRVYDRNARAVIEHRWGGDTLFVWCAEQSPATWSYEMGADKTSPVPAWLLADRVDVSVPAGIGFRYVGRWWPVYGK